MLKHNFKTFIWNNLNVNFCFIEQDGEGIVESWRIYEDKIQQLEKDLYFYKKTSRDLKKKLKEVAQETVQWQPAVSERKAFTITHDSNTVSPGLGKPTPDL